MTSPILANPGLMAVTQGKPRRVVLDLVLFYGVFGLLLFGPVAFGAVDPLSIFILEFGAALLFVLWLFKQMNSDKLKVTDNPLFLPMLAFAGLIVLQIMAGRSAYRHNSIAGALLYCGYGLLCFLTVQCLRKASQVKTLALIVSVYGTAIAFVALLQGLAPNGKVYWLREPHLGGWIYGPYVNHNHYAGLMEMLVPIPLVFCFTRYAYGSRKNLAALAAALMASTVFLSGSRGGMLGLALEIAIFATVVIRGQRNFKTTLAIAAFLVVVTGLLTWIGGGELAKRMASIRAETRTELSGGVRLSINRDGLHMFLERPVMGWGLATFPVVYPQFRSFYTNFFVNAAHDDYLQLLVETGALGFAIMIWFLVQLYRSSVVKLPNWSTNINGALSLAALLGCSGILVHSFLDFNLQIPANAALFYVLCVVAASQPVVESSRRSRSRAAEEIEIAISSITQSVPGVPAAPAYLQPACLPHGSQPTLPPDSQPHSSPPAKILEGNDVPGRP